MAEQHAITQRTDLWPMGRLFHLNKYMATPIYDSLIRPTVLVSDGAIYRKNRDISAITIYRYRIVSAYQISFFPIYRILSVKMQNICHFQNFSVIFADYGLFTTLI